MFPNPCCDFHDRIMPVSAAWGLENYVHPGLFVKSTFLRRVAAIKFKMGNIVHEIVTLLVCLLCSFVNYIMVDETCKSLHFVFISILYRVPTFWLLGL